MSNTENSNYEEDYLKKLEEENKREEELLNSFMLGGKKQKKRYTFSIIPDSETSSSEELIRKYNKQREDRKEEKKQKVLNKIEAFEKKITREDFWKRDKQEKLELKKLKEERQLLKDLSPIAYIVVTRHFYKQSNGILKQKVFKLKEAIELQQKLEYEEGKVSIIIPEYSLATKRLREKLLLRASLSSV